MKRFIEVIGYLVCWPPVGSLRDSESKKQALEGGMTLETPCRVCLLQFTLEAERDLFVVCTLFERKESDGEKAVDDLARSRRHLSVHSLVSPRPLYLICSIIVILYICSFIHNSLSLWVSSVLCYCYNIKDF